MPWPHAPLHRFSHAGAYMITASTYLKRHYLGSCARLEAFSEILFRRAAEAEASLHAWAIFSNHYHVIIVPRDPSQLPGLFSHLHAESARALNTEDGHPGRRIWFQFWDTALTFEKSYLARLNYVYANPVHHKLVGEAVAYPWCSAAWFEQSAPAAFVKTVRAFKVDRVRVLDSFEPEAPGR